ncbi:hypothetical protein DFH06DRAFT_1187234 [Mycena polygramma]|nr:hypothetical protein DFH06DRAFT_1187234 [Mycena polygramma]
MLRVRMRSLSVAGLWTWSEHVTGVTSLTLTNVQARSQFARSAMLLPLMLLPPPPGFAPVGAVNEENEAKHIPSSTPGPLPPAPTGLALHGIAPPPVGNESVIRVVDGEYQPVTLSARERRRLLYKKFILDFEEPSPRAGAVGIDLTPKSTFIPATAPNDTQPTNVDPLVKERRRRLVELTKEAFPNGYISDPYHLEQRPRGLRKLLEEIKPYSKVTPYRC